MFTAQTIRIDLGDGTEVFVANAPDGLWRIRSRHLVPRIVGTADLGRLGHADGRARVTDVGLFLQDGPCCHLPEDWEGRTFGSAQEAQGFVSQWRTEQR